MVAATILVCLLAEPTRCTQQTVRVEPAACTLRPYHVAVPLDGEWRRATIRISCRGAKA